MDYFPHDTHAMSDDRLLALRLRNGLDAVAVYWVILEKIYADEKPFDTAETNVEAMSVLHRLGIGSDVLENHVSAMVDAGLLERDADTPTIVMSARAQAQIDELCRKREIARQNGKSGGRKPAKPKRRNQKKTDVGSNGKPMSAPYKTENGIGFDKQNQIPTASGAGAEKTAPLADETSAIINAIDAEFETEKWREAAKKLMEFRQREEEMRANAVPCPANLNPFGGAS